jgi:hypothetical protein
VGWCHERAFEIEEVALQTGGLGGVGGEYGGLVEGGGGYTWYWGERGGCG